MSEADLKRVLAGELPESDPPLAASPDEIIRRGRTARRRRVLLVPGAAVAGVALVLAATVAIVPGLTGSTSPAGSNGPPPAGSSQDTGPAGTEVDETISEAPEPTNGEAARLNRVFRSLVPGGDDLILLFIDDYVDPDDGPTWSAAYRYPPGSDARGISWNMSRLSEPVDPVSLHPCENIPDQYFNCTLDSRPDGSQVLTYDSFVEHPDHGTMVTRGVEHYRADGLKVDVGPYLIGDDIELADLLLPIDQLVTIATDPRLTF